MTTSQHLYTFTWKPNLSIASAADLHADYFYFFMLAGESDDSFVNEKSHTLILQLNPCPTTMPSQLQRPGIFSFYRL